jgi:voltage-gated potassium channel
MEPEGAGQQPQERRSVGGRTRWTRADRSAASSPVRLSDLGRRDRHLALLRCGLTIVVAWVLIFGAYYVLPIGKESELRAGLRLAVDVALVASVFTWQIGRISRAELPELRAVEALGIVVALFLALFSGVYLAMSHNSDAFTQSLDETRALYFTVSVFSTVGFGDITPRTDTARLIVSAQMLLDLVVIGAGVRLIFSAARSRVESTPAPSE